MRTRKYTFFSFPDGFSIVDILALSFSTVYFAVVLVASFKPDTKYILEIQSNMNLLMATILGGYFGDQMVSRWKRKGKSGNTFWSCPTGFSIVDALSISFTIVYFTIVIASLVSPMLEHVREIQSNMNLLMATILGGYFGDQMVTRWNDTGPINEELGE